MKAKEVHDLSDADLAEKIKDLKEELFNLRFQLATRQLDNPMRIREVKKDIARAKTIQRQRELQGQQVGGSA
ncbi:MAG: 50S ribosomal protein L29 [Firmicutes bacterium RBG_13_65_8]|nr:MAG: 50S ribosomal protein L29 [Firmicutes bacterium RBG_13_65_8]